MMTLRAGSGTRGFSLMELLLAIGIFVGVMIAAMNIVQDFVRQENARSTVKYVESVADATVQVLSDIASFNTLYNATIATAPPLGGGYQLIADSAAPAADNIASPTGRFTVGGNTVQAARILNGRIRPLSPLNTEVRILLRAVTPAVAGRRALEVLVVTRTPRPNDLVQMAADIAAGNGGIIRTTANTAKAALVISNPYNSWTVTPSAGLQRTAWYLADLPAALNSTNAGSYLAYYRYVSLNDITGDYLYRFRDNDTVTRERNRMYSPLNAGGNDIVGIDNMNIGNGGSGLAFTAADVTASPECAGTVMCVNSTGILKGAGTVRDTVNIAGTANVADSLNASVMRVQNGLPVAGPSRTNYGAQGLYVVDGTGTNSDRIIVRNNARFNDGVTGATGNVVQTTATTVAMPNGSQYVTGTIGASAPTEKITSVGTQAGRLQVQNQVRAGVVQGGNVTATMGGNQGRIGVLDIRNSDNLVYGTVASQRRLVAPRVNINTMSVDSFGTCDLGCGN